MKKQKIRITALLLAAVLLAGCGRDSKIQVVVRKDAPEEADHSSGNAKNVREQVKAPEKLDYLLEFGNITVNVNAEVFVPDVEEIRQKKVQSRSLEEKDLQFLEEKLLKGKSVYSQKEQGETAYEEAYLEVPETEASMDGNVVPGEIDTDTLFKETAEGLEKFLKGEKAPSVETFAHYHEQLLWAMDGIPSPVQRRTAELLGILTETEMFLELGGSLTEHASLLELAGKEGVVFLENRPYNFYMNTFYGDSEVPFVQLRDPYVDSFQSGEIVYIKEQFGIEENGEDLPTLSEKDAIAFGEAFLKELGIQDMTLESAEESCFVFHTNSRYEDSRMEEGIALTFIKQADGIPVNYGENQDSVYMTASGLTNWPWERIGLAFAPSGLVEFYWTCPGKVEDWQEEKAFLLPFSEIERIFVEMIESCVMEQLGYYGEEGGGITLEIEEVCFGYTKVPSTVNTDNPTNETWNGDEVIYSGILIPAWSFVGRIHYSENPEYQDDKTTYMLINAMDGSIITK